MSQFILQFFGISICFLWDVILSNNLASNLLQYFQLSVLVFLWHYQGYSLANIGIRGEIATEVLCDHVNSVTIFKNTIIIAPPA